MLWRVMQYYRAFLPRFCFGFFLAGFLRRLFFPYLVTDDTLQGTHFECRTFFAADDNSNGA